MTKERRVLRGKAVPVLIVAILLVSVFAVFVLQNQKNESKAWRFYPIIVRNEGEAIENASVEVMLNLTGVSGTLNFFSKPDAFITNVLDSENMTEIGGGIWAFTVKVPYIPPNSTITIYYGILDE